MRGVVNFLERAGLIEAEKKPVPEPDNGEGESGVMHDEGLAMLGNDDAVSGVSLDLPPPYREEQIYADAGVPACPFPAERLLRLIDGLAAMDEATRKTAIAAMDAADDAWTIDDPIGDARLKAHALEAYSQTLKASFDEQRATIEALHAQSVADEEAAVAQIRKQIADLERLLERQLAQGADARADLQARLKVIRQDNEAQRDALSQRRAQWLNVVTSFDAPAASQAS